MPAKLRGKAWEAAANERGYEPFDPLNRVNLGRSVETALLSRPVVPLAEVPPFWGSGIYAIYLVDDARVPMDLYGSVAGQPAPIYVGRAVPKGARKGLVTDELAARSRALWDRLDEHRTSIEQAENLDVDGFGCRWLVADQLFVPMAEALMIATYHPVWNVAIDGFGNHNPGAGRYEGERTKWDTLHPGRPWAKRLAEPSVSVGDLQALVAEHFKAYPPEEAPRVPPLVGEVPVVEAVAHDEEALTTDQDDDGS